MYYPYLTYYDLSPCIDRLTILHHVNGLFQISFHNFLFYLESVVYAKGRLIIGGDFNIHIDDHHDNDVKSFLDLLYSLGLAQHATYPTHDKGHILDLITTRTEDACMTGMEYDWILPPDHCSIHFTTTFTKPRYERVVYSS